MIPKSVCDNCIRECQWRAPSGGLDPPVITCSRIISKPETNYERITSSVEALAKFITEIADCDECVEIHGFRMCEAAPEKACEDCWAGWLRQATEGD